VLKVNVADCNALATVSKDLNLQVDTGWLNRLDEVFVSDEFNSAYRNFAPAHLYTSWG
jgi:hypothetical protein